MLPQVSLFTGFSEEEMIKDGKIVLDAERMRINEHLDIRNKELGHVVFIKKEENGSIL